MKSDTKPKTAYWFVGKDNCAGDATIAIQEKVLGLEIMVDRKVFDPSDLWAYNVSVGQVQK